MGSTVFRADITIWGVGVNASDTYVKESSNHTKQQEEKRKREFLGGNGGSPRDLFAKSRSTLKPSFHAEDLVRALVGNGWESCRRRTPSS